MPTKPTFRPLGILIPICLLLTLAASAQKIVTQTPLFTTSGQSMWGPGAAPGLNDTIEIFPEFKQEFPFNTQSFTLFTVSGLKFGAIIDGKIGFGVGPLAFKIGGFTTGEIDANYPAVVQLEVPDDGTFNLGETVVINSSFSAGAGAQLNTIYPQAGTIRMDLGLFMSGGLGAQGCFIDCTPRATIIPDFELDTSFVFFEISPTGVTYMCADLLPPPPLQCMLSSGGPPWTIPVGGPYEGTVNLPYVATTSQTVGGKNILATGDSVYVTNSLNVIELLSLIPGPVGVAIGALDSSQPIITIPDVTGTPRSVTINWTIIGISMDFPITHNQEFLFKPRVFTRLNFQDTLEYVVHSSTAGDVPGKGVFVDYEVGDSVSINFPCTYDFMDFTATHSLKNTISNKTFDNFQVQLDFNAIAFGVTIDDYVIIPEVCIPIPFSSDLCIGPVQFSGTSVGFGPLIDPPPATLVSLDFPPYFQDEWELGGFNDVSIPDPFRLMPSIPQFDFIAQDVICARDSTGTIQTTATNATEPLTFDWSFGSTDRDPVGIQAGVHFLKLTDDNGCVFFESVTIDEPPPIDLSVQGDTILCNNDSTATLLALATGGTGLLNYLWNTGTTNPALNGQPAGPYSVTVTDENGCVKSENVTLLQPTPISAAIGNSIEPTCNGEENGSLDVFANGGSPPYQYLWSTGATSEQINNLGVGTYDVTVTDANGCIIQDSFTIGEPTQLTASLQVLSDVTCFAGDDGSLRVTPLGGTPPYRYSWLNQDVTLGSITATLQNVNAGNYTVEIMDQNDCALVLSAQVQEPLEPLAIELTATHATCFEDASGSIDLQISGGTPPYRYQWSTGETSQDLDAIPAGRYEVDATDNNDCTVGSKAVIIQPKEINAIVQKSDVSCSEQEDGTIEILKIIGGTPPYAIFWSTGDTTKLIEELTDGVYSFTIDDANGCSHQQEVEISKKTTTCVNIPNTFSPNNDGTNDVWNIPNMELYPQAMVRVFNRWGATLFESVGYLEPWDGSFNSTEVKSGTYYYVIDLQNGDPPYTGSITVIR